MTAHRFAITYELDEDGQRQHVFQPAPERGGWNRIELRREHAEDPWYQVGMEPVRDVQFEATPVCLPDGFAGP
ncbi:hypothetical protein [Halorarum salinum]|uniref:Uncharacterized protein n=1 Tax=Halorarum salinum TaxID=2743089 RepID=A0A7D5Q8M0_9EURY|nr:hypothetical protein [Halobaculum salinum]QLG61116.1 hypothetical protein HUG12_04945 [Halobaculum salinum]